MSTDPEAGTEARVTELEELVMRPGTYFNPQTEVLVIVDDSTSIDQSVFNMEEYEGAEWVRISDDVPVDGGALDAALFDTPCGVAVSKEGELYVADTGNHRVQKLSP